MNGRLLRAYLLACSAIVVVAIAAVLVLRR